jgi:hypothetical protein
LIALLTLFVDMRQTTPPIIINNYNGVTPPASSPTSQLVLPHQTSAGNQSAGAGSTPQLPNHTPSSGGISTALPPALLSENPMPNEAVQR